MSWAHSILRVWLAILTASIKQSKGSLCFFFEEISKDFSFVEYNICRKISCHYQNHLTCKQAFYLYIYIYKGGKRVGYVSTSESINLVNESPNNRKVDMNKRHKSRTMSPSHIFFSFRFSPFIYVQKLIIFSLLTVREMKKFYSILLFLNT